MLKGLKKEVTADSEESVTAYLGGNIHPLLRSIDSPEVATLCRMYTAQQKMTGAVPIDMPLTCLILVCPVPITLCFKLDEKHFDANVAYNVRFEMIKNGSTKP